MALLRQALRFAERHRGKHDGRVQAMLNPHAVDNCSPALLQATLAEARAADLLIQIHTAQYAHEVTSSASAMATRRSVTCTISGFWGRTSSSATASSSAAIPTSAATRTAT